MGRPVSGDMPIGLAGSATAGRLSGAGTASAGRFRLGLGLGLGSSVGVALAFGVASEEAVWVG